MLIWLWVWGALIVALLALWFVLIQQAMRELTALMSWGVRDDN
jgi:hypothetical protein